ncbi:sigma-70 family RNA polymerase sigma factor [Kiloniella laminariae]|uniref:sigma-70 family RNA polymerase sigma factor n=1 Tax=Kiloniella laminariae TaxID=454162 RepID=UPI00037381A9|nr:sigma-70 family RNA polymerase sigma factor [Kiloniella laminariae]
MEQKNILVDAFEARRSHLRSVAFRMLGSAIEAEDAVQETWLRLSRVDAAVVSNLSGWLTTVVARICLDMLRQRKARREDTFDESAERAESSECHKDTPEADLAMTDSVGVALLMVLETLSPVERLTLVLHDMFDVSYDDISSIIEKSPDAIRQIASRARRRVRGAKRHQESRRAERRKVVEAFLVASRSGDFEALLNVLDPEVTFRADEAALRLGGVSILSGAADVARAFLNRAHAAAPVLIDGEIAVAVRPDGYLILMLEVDFREDRIYEIRAVGDPARLAEAQLFD